MEETEKRVNEQFNDYLKRLENEYFELCYDITEKQKRLQVVEALLGFYQGLNKGE